MTMIMGSNFDLKNYTNYEMKTYKKTQIEEIDPDPPPVTSEPSKLFESWNTIIQKHSSDNLYRRFHKKK